MNKQTRMITIPPDGNNSENNRNMNEHGTIYYNGAI